jgi:hypothetical protein
MRAMVNRITPGLPVGAMQSYEIHVPLETHWRRGTCREVDCAHYLAGWETVLDEGDGDEMTAHRANYIRKRAGRSFREYRDNAGLTHFAFEPGQECFRSHQHRVRIDRPEIYDVVQGDWRARLSEPRVLPPHGWIEHWNENTYQLGVLAEKG